MVCIFSADRDLVVLSFQRTVVQNGYKIILHNNIDSTNSDRSCRKAGAGFAVKSTNVPGDRRDYGTAKRVA